MTTTTYINLARKYRPSSVQDLIGQEALVTTLQNAFTLNRIAHAFMLTGVRGVGKTTTARIIAKALNCVGADGNGDITLNPCGVCENCVAITEDRHMDIIEMDAASRTGVDDVRGIIENAKYSPVSARYKVFIIDEVHMLSKNAFNALLKTLEEPPPRLKFIFATTEIRKVPITVLSRCQRFDLQRITLADLTSNLAKICQQENIQYEDAGLFLLAKAAAGSARDSLSLLDQAIVHSTVISAVEVATMLGQGSISDVYNLFTAIINNDNQTSFTLLEQQYNKGIELSLLLEDLLAVCHHVTMYKILGNPPVALSEFEAQSANTLAQSTSLPALIKIWQILLKGLEEIHKATTPINTARMIIAKLTLLDSMGDVAKMITFINKNPEISKNISVAIPTDTPQFLPNSKVTHNANIEPNRANVSSAQTEETLSARDEIFIKKVYDTPTKDTSASTHNARPTGNTNSTGNHDESLLEEDITQQVTTLFPNAKKED